MDERTRELEATNAALAAEVEKRKEIGATLREQSEKLRRSEEQLRLALDAGRMGTWDWDIKTGELLWTGRLEEIHGFAPGTFLGTFESFISCVQPQDREPLAREILRYFVHGLLHLAGHEDEDSAERAAMEAAQESIVATLWTPELRERLTPDFLK